MNLFYTEESQIINTKRIIGPKEDQFATYSVIGLGEGC